MILGSDMFNVLPVDYSKKDKIQHRIDQKTKPQGSLGQLEKLALQLALIVNQADDNKEIDRIEISNPTMLVFAGDHGIARENISIAPSEVTQQMVHNFLNGGAAINCFCKINQMQLEVIDAGILNKINDERLIQQSLGFGTKNFVNDSAMTMEQVNKGLELGKKVIEKHIKQSVNCFAFGEMGIGNTSSASAIQSVLTQQSVEACVGRGTGIDDKTFGKKLTLITQAIEFHQSNLGSKLQEPMQLMAAMGGFEIVQMVGAMLAAAENRSLILVDGFIATSAALLATRIQPYSREYMVFCHQSEEQGHQNMLNELSAEPLLNLGLRLGEGTGAALAIPLIKAAASFYNDMASFEGAGVTAV